jgi:hypothetical protein
MRLKRGTLIRSESQPRKLPGGSAFVETLVSRQRSTSDASSRLRQAMYSPTPAEKRLTLGASQKLKRARAGSLSSLEIVRLFYSTMTTSVLRL